MNKKLIVWAAILLGLFVPVFSVGAGSPSPFPIAAPKSLVLYDASSGTLPDSSLMSFADFPFGNISPTYAGDAAILDTTVSGNDSFAGWVSSIATTVGFPVLDRAEGIQVNFTVQVESETHTRETRSGFSMIVLDKDKKGIELSFGENEIWAKSDDNTGGLFYRGEDTTFATIDMTAYQVILMGDTYSLTANGQPILSGPLRDYTAFDGFPDPYETPNFLFFGDNTTAAQARIRLLYISITGSEPVTPTNTGINIPPTVAFTPMPQASSTTIPTSAPTQPVVNLCPSGWLTGVVMAAGVMLSKKIRHT
ncbi:MAG: hypothetical protein QM730_25500 [Anaerolineales bacterium]